MNDLLRQPEQVMDKRQPDKRQELLPGIRRYYGKLTPLNFKNASAGYYRSYADIEKVAERIFEIVGNNSGLLFPDQHAGRRDPQTGKPGGARMLPAS